MKKKKHDKDPAAVSLGSKGGKSTRKRGKKYYSEIGKKGRAMQLAAKQEKLTSLSQ